MPPSVDRPAGAEAAPRWSRGWLAAATGGTVRVGLYQLVRRNLRGVWVRGELPVAPAVWISNHHSWWDFFVAAAALREAGGPPAGVLMDPENIANRDFYRVGAAAVGTDQLRAAVELIGAGHVLVVFPEGQLRPAGPLGPTRTGADWLARQAGVPLFPVAIRVVLRGQQAAEAYMNIGESRPATPRRPRGDPPGRPGELGGLGESGAGDDPAGQALATLLAGLDTELARADPEQPLPGFRRLMPGVRSWPERFGARPERAEQNAPRR